jgi:hypothetical protein
MATTEAFSRPSDLGAEEFQYRPMSVGAIIALVFGLLSPLTFLTGSESLAGCLMVCPIPAIGILIGLKAWARVRVMPDQASGGMLALAGVALSLVGLVGGLSFAGYVYATEVPPGYTRTSFGEFRPDEVEQRGNLLVPRRVQQLEGQKVFIKGYMRPGSAPVRTNIRQFLLVRDNNQCCFGDISSVKYFDQVLVSTIGSLSTDYSSGVFRVGGTLHIHPENILRGVDYPVYTLEADHLE